METRDIKIYIEEGILFCTAYEELQLELKTAKAIIEKLRKVSDGKILPMLFDWGRTQYADKEVRKYLTEEGCQGIMAIAYCTNGFVANLFIDSSLKTTTSEIPTQVFSEKKEAVKWLRNFIV